jgi:hypothetical protein
VKVVFGIELEVGGDDWYVNIAEDILSGVVQAGIPGQFLVDILPIRTSRGWITSLSPKFVLILSQLSTFLNGSLVRVFRNGRGTTANSYPSSLAAR